jgi:hypothetical protein
VVLFTAVHTLLKPVDFYMWRHMKDLMYGQKMETDRDLTYTAMEACNLTEDALLCHILDVTKLMERKYMFMRFEVLRAVLMKMDVFWDMLSCQLVYSW